MRAPGSVEFAYFSKPASHAELLEERLRHLLWSGRDDDPVKRRLLGQALVPVSGHDDHVLVAKGRERSSRALRELREDLDRVDLFDQAGEDGGLIPRARSDLEHPVPGFWIDELRHGRDDVRLGDRLAAPDGKRSVSVRVGPHDLRNEEVSRDGPHRLENPLV
jgi:hypothetical protein